jgi:hypothetical protein
MEGWWAGRSEESEGARGECVDAGLAMGRNGRGDRNHCGGEGKKRDSENGATRSDPEKVEGRQARLGESIDFWR